LLKLALLRRRNVVAASCPGFLSHHRATSSTTSRIGHRAFWLKTALLREHGMGVADVTLHIGGDE
jgi:hypothetical protein